jgi:hypothetical protein
METKKERVFSVELKSKQNLKSITVTDGTSDSVFIEGNIGELVQARFAEGIILEVVGKNGVLRVDLCEEEILKTAVQENPTTRV